MGDGAGRRARLLGHREAPEGRRGDPGAATAARRPWIASPSARNDGVGAAAFPGGKPATGLRTRPPRRRAEAASPASSRFRALSTACVDFPGRAQPPGKRLASATRNFDPVGRGAVRREARKAGRAARISGVMERQARSDRNSDFPQGLVYLRRLGRPCRRKLRRRWPERGRRRNSGNRRDSGRTIAILKG